MSTSSSGVQRPWQMRGNCARTPLPLSLWDVETERPAAQLSLAQTLCYGCPVASACASAALASAATGQIRAGIPISAERATPVQVEALTMVADGAPMVLAALHIAQAGRYWSALHTLWAVATATAQQATARALAAKSMRGVL